MAALRVLFAGTPEVAVPALELLLADGRFDVVGVLTNPDRPRGRSSRPVPSPVAARARAAGLPLLQPERARDAAAEIAATGAEVGAVVAFGSILPQDVLDALPFGFVNLHFSLLPRWRGAAPVQHAIRAGDPVTGVTAFRLDAGMDTGPVLRTLEVVPPGDVDAGVLLDALALEGAPVLADALLAVAAGELGTAQPEDGATHAPRIGPADAMVRWELPAEVVARHIRSVTPRPGAVTLVGGERLKVAGASPRSRSPHGDAPGTVLGVVDDGIEVACGAGTVLIERLQPAGRPWTAAVDQVRGRRILLGSLLGAADDGS